MEAAAGCGSESDEWEVAGGRRRARTRRGGGGDGDVDGGDGLRRLLARGGARLRADLAAVAAGARPAMLLDYAGAPTAAVAVALAAACAPHGPRVRAWLLADGFLYVVNSTTVRAMGACASGAHPLPRLIVLDGRSDATDEDNGAGDGNGGSSGGGRVGGIGAAPRWGTEHEQAALRALVCEVCIAGEEAAGEGEGKDEGAFGETPRSVVDLRVHAASACARAALALPCLSGALLGYPVTYAFSPTEAGAAAAGRALGGSGSALTLFEAHARSESARSSTFAAHETPEPIAAFTVPSALCPLGAREGWARAWGERLGGFNGRLWERAVLVAAAAPSQRLVL